jgi:hypothetical protein
MDKESENQIPQKQENVKGYRTVNILYVSCIFLTLIQIAFCPKKKSWQTSITKSIIYDKEQWFVNFSKNRNLNVYILSWN